MNSKLSAYGYAYIDGSSDQQEFVIKLYVHEKHALCTGGRWDYTNYTILGFHWTQEGKVVQVIK